MLTDLFRCRLYSGLWLCMLLIYKAYTLVPVRLLTCSLTGAAILLSYIGCEYLTFERTTTSDKAKVDLLQQNRQRTALFVVSMTVGLSRLADFSSFPSRLFVLRWLFAHLCLLV